ncbi:MAG: hypothetical protein QI197_07160 [Candidatus Korarchaeota archaeon]|nr:hypothetical protein [Candidatus Korarchaeota archaeon]
MDDRSIDITRISLSRLPQAARPGEIIVKFWFDLTTSDPQNTQPGVEASGNNIDVLSKMISMSTRSWSIRIYMHAEAKERVSPTIKVTCRINGAADTDSKNMGSSHVVYTPPSWSPSITPREISKRDEILLEVDGLNDLDDDMGELSVTAISRKDSTVGALGEPSLVGFTLPTQVYRGDVLRMVVSENDGGSLTGVLTAFGREYALEGRKNMTEVPRDVDADQHPIKATVEDVDGSNSGSWTLEILNVPSQVEISPDRDEVELFRPSYHVLRRERSGSRDVELVVAIMAVSLVEILVIRRGIS